jgi:hypothetical protein
MLRKVLVKALVKAEISVFIRLSCSEYVLFPSFIFNPTCLVNDRFFNTQL